MTARRLWIVCAAAGVAAFVCSWGFGRIAGLVACGPSGGVGPIIAFELVRSPADVATLFGSEPCRSTLAAAQKTGLLLDGLGFIPFYTAFLILAAAATAVRGWAKVAIIAVLAVAGLGDEIEGFILRQILDALPGTQGSIDTLFWVVHGKFALLALGTAGIGVTLAMNRRWPALLAGIWIGVWGLHALWALASSAPKTMMTAFAVAWISLLLVAFIAAIWPSAFSPRIFSGVYAAQRQDPAAPSA